MKSMKAVIGLRPATVLAMAAAVLAGTGCVLVVGEGGAHRGADVEWAGTRHSTASAAPRSIDDGLVREVESRVRMDSALQREDITVSSSGDVVTLHGRVSDIAVLEHVMRVAAETPGVKRVVSRLTVTMEAG